MREITILINFVVNRHFYVNHFKMYQYLELYLNLLI